MATTACQVGAAMPWTFCPRRWLRGGRAICHSCHSDDHDPKLVDRRRLDFQHDCGAVCRAGILGGRSVTRRQVRDYALCDLFHWRAYGIISLTQGRSHLGHAPFPLCLGIDQARQRSLCIGGAECSAAGLGARLHRIKRWMRQEGLRARSRRLGLPGTAVYAMRSCPTSWTERSLPQRQTRSVSLTSTPGGWWVGR